MNGAGSRSGGQEVTVDGILQLHALLAGDVVEINATTWAIHGFIAVDGDVLIAEFDRQEDAWVVLGEVVRRPPSAPTPPR